ncbi:MAG: hypothetical protein ACLQFI_13490 [Methylocella sp.]
MKRDRDTRGFGKYGEFTIEMAAREGLFNAGHPDFLNWSTLA